MMTLRDTRVGQCVRVAGLRAGLGASEQQRLGELGFCEGAHVRFLCRAPLGGPYVYEVSGAVFSLEARLVHHIDVQPEDVLAEADAASSVAPGADAAA